MAAWNIVLRHVPMARARWVPGWLGPAWTGLGAAPLARFRGSAPVFAASGRDPETGTLAEDAGVSVTREIDQAGIPTGTVILTLSNPGTLNSLTPEMGMAFRRAVVRLRKQGPDELRAVVVTGADGAFSSGGNLDFLESLVGQSVQRIKPALTSITEDFLSVRNLPVPTIAAINGPAVGAGLCLAMACDMRIAGHTAKLGLNFSRLGLHPGFAASYYLPLLVGSQAAARLLVAGDMFTGEEGRRLGLVLGTTPPDNVLPVALRLADKVSSASPATVRATIMTLRAQQDGGLPAAMQREIDEQTASFLSRDIIEGFDAIRSKRRSRFPPSSPPMDASTSDG